VFESSGYDNAWDGTNEDGTDLSAGCYFYYIEIGKDTEPIKGTVTIVR
jgi:predicted Zn-dependent protease